MPANCTAAAWPCWRPTEQGTERVVAPLEQALTGLNGMEDAEAPRFLAVQLGDVVAVQAGDSRWLGQVIHAEGGARCHANSLFQIACVDRAGSAALQPTHDQGHQRQGSGQGNQESNRHDG